MKISLVLNPDLTKSSVFSLMSITVDITVRRITEKTKVEMNFLNMYQSIFFINGPN